MGLSKKDIEYLEELTSMYRSGQLSEAAFKHASSLVLNQAKEQSFSPKKTLATTQPILPRVQEQQLSGERVKLISMRKSEKYGSISATLTTTFIALALGIALGFVRSVPIQTLQNKTNEATAFASIDHKDQKMGKSISPLFGSIAISSCQTKCASINPTPSCNQACEKLSFSEYARRITLVDLDPKKDALLIEAKCKNAKPQIQLATQTEWKNKSETALKLISSDLFLTSQQNLGKIRALFNDLATTHNSLSPPIKSSSETKRTSSTLARAVCLHAHLALTEMASIIALEGNDSYSRSYYLRLSTELRIKADEVKNSLKSAAQEKER
jgi:hypothetical protein